MFEGERVSRTHACSIARFSIRSGKLRLDVPPTVTSVHAADECREILRTKMSFRFRSRRKRQRRLFAQGCVSRDLSGFLFPALDHRGIADDLDLPLIIGKAQSPAETLLV